MSRIACGIVAALFGAAPSASGAATLAGLQLGTHIYGPKIEKEDLAGRIVLYEFWGRNCGPCIQSMPHLVRWAKEHAAAGLVVIGNHVQPGTDAEVASVCRRLKTNFTITRGGSIQGVNVQGIPRLVIFDAKGNSVFEGHPGAEASAIDRQIQQLIRESPPYILEGRQLEKLRALAEPLKSGKGFGRVHASAKEKLSSKDAAEAEEAKFLLERLEEHAGRMLDRARALESEDAFEAFVLYNQVQSLYAGAPFAVAAKKRLAELEKEKAFQREVEAGKIAAKIFEASEELQPLKPSQPIDLSDPDCFKRNKKSAAAIVGGYRALKKGYEQTRAFAKVKALLETFGLKE